MGRQRIGFILKYSGLGLLVAVAFYLSQNSFDYNALGISILGLSFVISSVILK